MQTMGLTEEEAWMVLNAIPQIGPVTFDKLRSSFKGDLQKIFTASRAELKRVEGVGDTGANYIEGWKDVYKLEKDIARMKELGGEFVTRDSEGYSKLLKEVYDPPIGLYYLGNSRPQLKTIGIVGSRRSTLYGMSVARKLAGDLARMGFCIVSGMARGIDSAAHEGAIEAGGQTVAVLGCGADVVYPPESKDLYKKIQENGAIISEFTMGRTADKMTFPRRNRIVSGMSHAVVVVETNSNGGSMITARMANEQGRHVFAVPGRIDQASSKGCNELIRDGASLLTCADDILEELNYLAQPEFNFSEGGEASFDSIPQGLEGLEKELYVSLKELGLVGVDQLANHCKRKTQEVSSGLLMLELKKLIVKRVDGTFEAGQPGGHEKGRPPRR